MSHFKVKGESELVQEFEGFGAQYNQNVYAPVSAAAGVTQANVGGMERRVADLKPGFVRIFFDGAALTPGKDPQTGKPIKSGLMLSFEETVRLAERTATTINITFQGIGKNVHRKKMPDFADVLADLVTNQGISKLKWVTIRNEPNRPAMDRELYRALYEELDRELVSRGVRSKIKFMGGDLLEMKDSPTDNQRVWLKFLATKPMSDLLDAFSIHVYWSYWDTEKLQKRLKNTRDTWDKLSTDFRKPLYVTEFGVRGDKLHQVKPNPGFYDKNDKIPLGNTNIYAFQHAWFALQAAKLGYRGVVKWDAYFARYGSSQENQQMAFGLVGGPPEWLPTPAYHLMRLLTMCVTPGSRVVDVSSDDDTALVVAFESPAGHWSVVGLDTRGGSLNETSLLPDRSYHLEGLPENTAFQLRYWNRAGKSQVSPPRTLRSNGSGALEEIKAPIHSVFAITSEPTR